MVVAHAPVIFVRYVLAFTRRSMAVRTSLQACGSPLTTIAALAGGGTSRPTNNSDIAATLRLRTTHLQRDNAMVPRNHTHPRKCRGADPITAGKGCPRGAMPSA